MFNKVARWMSGRHTLFAAFFAVAGTVLEVFHRLDMNYVALIGAVQGFVLMHSAKEDYFAAKNVPQADPDPKGADDASATK